MSSDPRSDIRVAVAFSPCSGHGAKFAALTGEMTAALAIGDAAPEPRFTLNRF
ncbi:hypothetical protein [Actinoplanes derwentensis]|uniref:hypothetical protein n=1 Tax=Actinoplanes derwentensis TaxID=113562 RepID=UPI0018D2E2F0|nr:hypothetical protein [Actinoplanes derwentensis]GID89281.1 hypothetical protein Ade03nite_82050 [Actinoplanes derwentensis]